MENDGINKTNSVDLTVEEKTINDFILQTLLFTPLVYIKTQSFVEIKVYAPEDNQPSMKIFRMIARYSSQSDPNLIEIGFQDEIDILKEGRRDSMKRWQVNFSVLVDKESYKFSSLHDKPAKIIYALESIKIFGDLSRKKGSNLYAGNWRFQSDGNSWIRVDRNGKPIKQLDGALLLIEKL